jgi:spermidine synthase
MDQAERRRAGVLLASAFVVAACAIGYELLLGAISSYLLGDSIRQFSLAIGTFLAAMGLGSYLSKYIPPGREIGWFVGLEIALAAIGGASSFVLMAAYGVTTQHYGLVAAAMTVVIGALIGIEVPLLARVVGRWQSLPSALASVFALDYLGALAASLAFALVLLPTFGLLRSSFAFGFVNAAVAIATGLTFRAELRRPRALIGGAVLAGVLLAVGFALAPPVATALERRAYQDEIVFAEQTPYQRIVLTRFRDDVRLYLNGALQLSSLDEARYHEALVHVPMALVPRPEKVLLLGAGDGMAVRELLKYPEVRAVTVVDLDEGVTRLARTNPRLKELNGGSLDDPRVTVVHEDAVHFLAGDATRYSLIIADLPDPNDIGLGKLYSREFYLDIGRHLAADGVMVTQATSPYFSREAFWSIAETVGSVLPHVLPYSLYVPSFGEWGFVMASARAIEPPTHVTVPARYLSDAVLPELFVFDAETGRVDAPVNTLDNQAIVRLYDRGWSRWFPAASAESPATERR